MGYRIHYPGGQEENAGNGSRLRLPLLTMICFFLFLSLVKWMWPEGYSLIRGAFSGVWVELGQFAESFREGDTAFEAISGFCRSFLL